MKYTIHFRMPLTIGTEDIKEMLTELGVALVPEAPLSQTAQSITVETVNTYTPQQLTATSQAIWTKIVETAVTIAPES